LNLTLLALLAGAGWRLRENWQQAREREAAVLGQFVELVPSFAEPEPSGPGPVTAVSYLDIADMLLFVPDRNPVVVLDVAPAEAMPPLPVAHGVLDLGSGPTAILSEKPGDPQRGVRAGERMGDFRLVRVTATELVFEWAGKMVRRRLEELMPEDAGQPPAESGASPPKPVAAEIRSTVLAPSPASKAGPGEVDMGGGIMACRPGDTSPPGTVVGGYRKLVTQTPFGQQCRWEPVR